MTARPLLGDEQQVVEEEEVPLLALQTLQGETKDDAEIGEAISLLIKESKQQSSILHSQQIWNGGGLLMARSIMARR